MDLFMFAVLLVFLAFVAAALLTMSRWQGVWRLVAALPLVVVGWAVWSIALHPASHNLLPFELIMWVVVGFFILGVAAAVRSRVLKQPKTECVRGHGD